jgi:hypothetical protein
LDANAIWSTSGCEGYIYTGMKKTGVSSDFVVACEDGPGNNIAAASVGEYALIGRTQGTGYVYRMSQTQPYSHPAWRCGGWCVFITGGSQTIRIEPWSTHLSVTADPAGAVEGDTVTFTASSTQNAPMTGFTWTWRPDVQATDTVTVNDPRTSTSGCTSATCKVPVFGSGTMYVAAVTWGSRQQAKVHVYVDRLSASLSCTPNPVVRDNLASCTVAIQPTTTRSTVEGWTFDPDTTLYPLVGQTQFNDSSLLSWAGNIVAQGWVTAAVRLRGRDTIVETILTVQARQWAEVPLTIGPVTSGTLPTSPTSHHELGAAFLDLIPNIAPYTVPSKWVCNTTEGPNRSYCYFRDAPWRATADVSISPALDSGSALYLLHGNSRVTEGGKVYCARSDFAAIRSRILQHEGESRTTAGSHIRGFVERVDSLTRTEAERFVTTTA